MKEAEVWRALKGNSMWDNASTQCHDGFILCAVYRSYSADDLVNAFGWYNQGWQEAIDVANLMLSEVQ